jgi:ketosteroid isomerase-like protein
MTNHAKYSTMFAALALLAGCRETPERAAAHMQAETNAAKPLIQAQLAKYVRGATSGNTDTLLSLYTDDAVLMPPNRPAISGRDKIRAAFASVGSYGITFATTGLTVTGDVAIERGIWQARMAPPGGSLAVVRDGKYLTHWHRINGTWLMAEQIWNDDYKPMGM